jgi:hypothetical protein
MRYLIPLFPDLDDLYIDDVFPASIRSAQEWSGCGIKYSQRLSGTLQFFNSAGGEDSKIFASIVSLSPGFHTISPGKITNLNWGAVQGLMEACAETVELVPFLWSFSGMICDLCRSSFTLLTVFAIDRTPPTVLSSCKKLRKAGFGMWDNHSGLGIQNILSSIMSKHLSVVTLEIAHPDWCLYWRYWEEFYQRRRNPENPPCQPADRCLANNKLPLVLEIFWWRQAGHNGDCGATYSDTILPKFREKGSIRFMESSRSNCERCAAALGEARSSA